MTNHNIPFNQLYLTGQEQSLIAEAIAKGHIAGDGPFTRACEQLLEEKYGFNRALLTASCTDALELAALLLDISPGDEVIMPSYSFPSTGNAFILRGANIVFADSNPWNPNIDIDEVEQLITPNTKAIVVVHYAGMACPMEQLMQIATRHRLYIIEDAAQAIDSYYGDIPLGRIGHLAAFSFHETKNVTCGEGGLLVINDPALEKRAEIIREKGTNRPAFMRHEVARYDWVDIGSSFLLSELNAAFLLAQLRELDHILADRRKNWQRYADKLADLGRRGLIQLPGVPAGSHSNGHIFYFLCHDVAERARYINYMHSHGVQVRSHYTALHQSPFFKPRFKGHTLANAIRYAECLVRLPLFCGLTEKDQDEVINLTTTFFNITTYP